MRNTPLISVIIPTFNAKLFIRQAIDSVLRQTFDDFEILVLDSVSVDGTVEVLNSYQDRRLRYISEKDSGIYEGMNKGIELASGEWLYFLGSDDILHDDYVLSDVAKFIQENDGIAEVVYGNVLIIGSNHWAANGDIYDGKFSTNKILQKNLCHQSVFYRSQFIRTKIGYYNVNYRVCADWDFNLRCWPRTNFLYIDRIIANFTAGGQSTQNAGDSNFSAGFLSNVLTYFNFHLFDPHINHKSFLQYGELCALQKKVHPIKWFLFRLKSKVANLFVLLL